MDSTLEHATIDMLLDCGATGAPASSIDRSIVASLYTKGLVWLDVPIAGADCVTLTSLEGFVMNRVRGDFMETMLYKIFVTLDERTPVAQLAEVLQAPEEDVRAAVSLFVRLGFAERIVYELLHFLVGFFSFLFVAAHPRRRRRSLRPRRIPRGRTMPHCTAMMRVR